MDRIDFSSSSFWVGVVATIVLGIVANLLTPDRHSVANSIRVRIDRFRNWLAKLSARRAKKRIDELRKELDRVSSYADSDAKLSRFLMGQISHILSDLCLATMLLSIALLFPARLLIPLVSALSSVAGLLSVLLYLIATVRGERIKGMLSKVRDYPEYAADIEKSIADLKEVVAKHSAFIADTAPVSKAQQTSEIEGISYREGFGEDLLEKIKFDYTDSLAEHGWRISGGQGSEPPTFRSIPYGRLGKAMEIKSVFGRKMDYDVKPSTESGSLIEFVAKYEKESAIYARLCVHSEDVSDEPMEVWLAFVDWGGEPKQTSSVEWRFPVKPTDLEGDWPRFWVDLHKAAKETFGKKGWEFTSLKGFRLRGSLSLAHISVYK